MGIDQLLWGPALVVPEVTLIFEKEITRAAYTYLTREWLVPEREPL